MKHLNSILWKYYETYYGNTMEIDVVSSFHVNIVKRDLHMDLTWKMIFL